MNGSDELDINEILKQQNVAPTLTNTSVEEPADDDLAALFQQPQKPVKSNKSPISSDKAPIPKKKSKIGVIVSLLVLGGLGGFFVYSSYFAKNTPVSIKRPINSDLSALSVPKVASKPVEIASSVQVLPPADASEPVAMANASIPDALPVPVVATNASMPVGVAIASGPHVGGLLPQTSPIVVKDVQKDPSTLPQPNMNRLASGTGSLNRIPPNMNKQVPPDNKPIMTGEPKQIVKPEVIPQKVVTTPQHNSHQTNNNTYEVVRLEPKIGLVLRVNGELRLYRVGDTLPYQNVKITKLESTKIHTTKGVFNLE